MPAREAKVLQELRRTGVVVAPSRLGAVIHAPDEDAETVALAGIPAAAADAVVSATPALATHPRLLDALVAACRCVAGRRARYWIAVDGLSRWGVAAGAALRSVAAEHGAEVLAPGTSLVAAPGGVLFAGRDGGSWYRFAPGRPEHPVALRYPVPSWEHAMPRQAVATRGLLVEPVPAGVLIRAGSSAPDGHATPVPVSYGAPKVLIGQPGEWAPEPAAVAAALHGIPGDVLRRMLVVPCADGAFAWSWLRSLAAALGHDVCAMTGPPSIGPDGRETVLAGPGMSWRPLARVLSHGASGAPRVVLAAPPPRGFLPGGPLHHLPTGPRRAREQPVLRALPAGLALLTAEQLDRAAVLEDTPAEPDRLRVLVGLPGEALPPHTADVLGATLRELRAGSYGPTAVTVLGTVTDGLRATLCGVIPDGPEAIEFRGGHPASVDPGTMRIAAADIRSLITPKDRATAPETATSDPAAAGMRSAATPRHRTVAAIQPAALELAVAETATPHSAAPVPATTDPTGPPSRTPGAATPAAPAADESTPDGPGDAAENTPEGVVDGADALGGGPEDAGSVSTSDTKEPVGPPRLRLVAEPAEEHRADPMLRFAGAIRPEPNVADDVPVTLVPALPRPPLVAVDHRSTVAERDGFVRAYATEYDEAVASVNAALATSPGLRTEDVEVGKVDFVAVRLYTTEGRAGGGALNERLRGTDATAEDYLACLTSGLRRLPVHRGAAFGFAGLGEDTGATNPYRQGAVLAEPGLFSTTAEHDYSAPGADVDLVVWSRSGRRTGAFGGQELPREVVFGAGSRFKVLAVEPGGDDGTDAVLLRELRPGETGSPGGLDEGDEVVLAKLRHALQRRRSAELRMLRGGEYLRRVVCPLGLVSSAGQSLAAAG